MTRRFLVTAALPYANGRLHVGHIAGCYLPADIFVRYLRSRGDQVRFICGSDDYGVPNLLTAGKEGVTPSEVVRKYNGFQKTEFDGLGISFDIYGGTSECPHHTPISQAIFRKVADNGYFQKKEIEQLYDPEAGMFLADRYVKGTCYHVLDDGSTCGYPEAYGDQCEKCGRTIDALQLVQPVSVITGARPEVRKTIHWFLDLSRFEKPLADWIDSHPEWRPAVRNFATGLLRLGLPARAMTRDLSWGIPVPLEDPDAEGKVLYVWFDAPIGYVSFTAEHCEAEGGSPEDYADWWKNPDCKIYHFIGEDNIVFHALTWPAVLMAEGSFSLPHNVVANCFLNFQFPGKEEEKMSKSRGTAVWIHEYLQRFQPDPLRYYLTAIAPENQRTAFNFELFVRRNNEELVSTFGNFAHRTLTFVQKYFDGKVPEPGEREALDLEQIQRLQTLRTDMTEELEACRFKNALAVFMAAMGESNKYFDYKKPWVQRKQDLAACGTTLNVCLQTLRAAAVLAEPFLPHGAERLTDMLALTPEEVAWDRATDPVEAGRVLRKPEILYEKIDLEPPAE
jgi:methionyl-tRNA synthetase